jgi:hypothetical protein
VDGRSEALIALIVVLGALSTRAFSLIVETALVTMGALPLSFSTFRSGSRSHSRHRFYL